MARKKKPTIRGIDPEYETKFDRFTPIPSTMPPSVKTTGMEATPTESAPKKVKQPSKPKQSRKLAEKPKSAKPKSSPEKKPDTSQAPVGDRQTTLDAAVRRDQAEMIAPFEAKGLKMKDIVTLAGRRATERFTLEPVFVPKAEAERLPMRDGYHTSKRLPGHVLDDLRKEHDPLGISSDPAMVRGQFEKLFWTCLDEVIEELNSRYA